MAEYPERVMKWLRDETLMEHYADATKHLGTTDLVMWLDVSNPKAPDIQGWRRTDLIASSREPGGEVVSEIAEKVSVPASEKMKTLETKLAFWLVLELGASETYVVAVGGQRVGGTMIFA